MGARTRARQRDAAQDNDFRRAPRSEEHTSELQSRLHLVCRLLLEKKKKQLTQAADDARPGRRPHNTLPSLNSVNSAAHAMTIACNMLDVIGTVHSHSH